MQVFDLKESLALVVLTTDHKVKLIVLTEEDANDADPSITGGAVDVMMTKALGEGAEVIHDADVRDLLAKDFTATRMAEALGLSKLLGPDDGDGGCDDGDLPKCDECDAKDECSHKELKQALEKQLEEAQKAENDASKGENQDSTGVEG